MRKFLVVLVILVLVMSIITNVAIIVAMCNSGNSEKMPDVMTAKIRYFDGSTDTLQITRYSISDGTVTVWTRDGQVCISSANNIILLSDDDYPRD